MGTGELGSADEIDAYGAAPEIFGIELRAGIYSVVFQQNYGARCLYDPPEKCRDGIR